MTNQVSRPQLQPNQPVQVTVLGSSGTPVAAVVGQISGRRIDALLDKPLPVETLVRLDWADSLLLAEVRGCKREGKRFVVALEGEHMLTGLSGLDRWAEPERFAEMAEALLSSG